MQDVTMPAFGMAMSEATLLRWLRSPGEAVAAGDPLAEIETDKTMMDIESPASGVLGAQLVAEGTTVAVGERLSTIIEDGDEAGAMSSPAPDPTAIPPAELPEPAGTSDSSKTMATAPAEASTDWRTPHAESPRARRERLEAASAGPADAGVAAPPTTVAGAASVQASSGRHRAIIAAKVSQSWREIPHFAVVREIDAGVLMRVREDVRSTAPAATVTDLLLRALATALHETGSGEPVNVGLAVDTPDGVAIPIVPDVLGRSLQGLASTRAEVVGRALSGQLRPEDLEAPAVATLSNLGTFGIDAFTGVIYPGQTSLLTVGRVASRAVVEDGVVVPRSTLIATLNVDHRVLDGADAARLLGAFAAAIGRPAALTGEDAAA